MRTGERRSFLLADFTMRYPDGTKERVREVAPTTNKRLAEQWERQRKVEKLHEWEQK